MSLATAAPRPRASRSRLSSQRLAAPGFGWALPSTPATLLANPDRNVVAIRRRDAIALGGLMSRRTVDAAAADGLLVSASTPDASTCWLPADAVWSDAPASGSPNRPRPIGLANADSEAAAVIAGLSDRLGWEAAHHIRSGGEFTELRSARIRVGLADGTRVLDGRLGHDVPTVVLLCGQTVRWGAGATHEQAIQRALYGTASAPPPQGFEAELAKIDHTLRAAGLGVASVDLGSVTLRSAGIFRSSSQLFASAHDAGRSWDADFVH